MTISKDLIRPNDVDTIKRLTTEAIETVYVFPNDWTITPRRFPRNMYNERPTAYMVKLQGEKRKRRVYAAPIGNVAVFYLKTKHGNVYCETALDHALARAEDDHYEDVQDPPFDPVRVVDIDLPE